MACNCGKRTVIGRSSPPPAGEDMEIILMSLPGKLPMGTFLTMDGTRYHYKRQLYVYKRHEKELRDRGYERP